MTFEEWWEGLGRSYNPEIIWLTAQIAMRERAAKIANAGIGPSDSTHYMNEIARIIERNIRDLQPE